MGQIPGGEYSGPDMWIFKADITGCFNQLYWDQHTSPLMGFLLDDDTLMLMLT